MGTYLDYPGLAHFYELLKKQFVVQEKDAVLVPRKYLTFLQDLYENGVQQNIEIGSVASVEELPQDKPVGSIYNVEQSADKKDGMNYIWTGEAWDAMGKQTDSITHGSIDSLFQE